MAAADQSGLARFIQGIPLLRALHAQGISNSRKSSRPLLGILATALLAAITLPLVNILIIFPAYSEQVITTIEEGAKRMAAFTIPPAAKYAELSPESIESPHLLATIYRLEKNFELLKLNIFSPEGMILYSSDPTETNTITDAPIFHDVVAKGETHSAIIKFSKRGPDGEMKYIDVVATFIPVMRDDLFLGAFEFYFDITPIKHTMDRFNSYATYGSIVTSLCILIVVVILLNKESSRIEALQQAEKLREDVEQITRHDLKSPLVGTLNGINYLERFTKIDEEQQEMLADMRASVVNGLDMINKGLDIYKMENGTYEYEPVLVDIMAVLRRVTTDLSGLAKSTKVTISVQRFDRTDDEELIISGDQTLCYSLFANLVKNAIEASEQDCQVSITIDANGEATVTIHNESLVPDIIRDRFFEKLVTTGKRGGTGLGTYSASLITRTMGGTISMKSIEEEGTTITVALPLAQQTDS